MKSRCEFEIMQVFQKRQDGSVDFYRNWALYASGFGDLDGEFWLGNEDIHAITNASGKTYELRVDLDDGTETRVALYNSFKIYGSQDKYQIQLGSYDTTASNAGEKTVISKCWYYIHYMVTFVHIFDIISN